MKGIARLAACSLAVGILASPGVARTLVPDASLECVREAPPVGGPYLRLEHHGFDFTPQALVAAPDGSLLIGGVCGLEERNGVRSGFGVIKLTAEGVPDPGFGKKLGDAKIGLAFVPVGADEELIDVVGMSLQPGKAGREKVVLAGNVKRTGGAACAGAVRVNVSDGKPSKLNGKLAPLFGFGQGLEGSSRARSLAVSADQITIGGDWNGHPAFVRLDGKTGKPADDFGESGRCVVPVESFAVVTYEHTTAIDACVVEPSGAVLGVGHLLAEDESNKAFQILVVLQPDGQPDKRFGLPSVEAGGSKRLGATTSYYEMPVSGELAIDLSMHSAVVADAEAPYKLFVGLGMFQAAGEDPLCSINLMRLSPEAGGLEAEDPWELDTDIFAVNPMGMDPRETPFQPVALLAQKDGEVLALITDAGGHLYGSQHNVLDRFYPDDVRDLEPILDGERRADLLYGVKPVAAGKEPRFLAALQDQGAREMLVVLRAVEEGPMVLRRFNTNNGALDEDF